MAALSLHTWSSVPICTFITLLTVITVRRLWGWDNWIGPPLLVCEFSWLLLFLVLHPHPHPCSQGPLRWCCCHLILPRSGQPSAGQSVVTAHPHLLPAQWSLQPWPSCGPELLHFHFWPFQAATISCEYGTPGVLYSYQMESPICFLTSWKRWSLRCCWASRSVIFPQHCSWIWLMVPSNLVANE